MTATPMDPTTVPVKEDTERPTLAWVSGALLEDMWAWSGDLADPAGLLDDRRDGTVAVMEMVRNREYFDDLDDDVKFSAAMVLSDALRILFDQVGCVYAGSLHEAVLDLNTYFKGNGGQQDGSESNPKETGQRTEKSPLLTLRDSIEDVHLDQHLQRALFDQAGEAANGRTTGDDTEGFDGLDASAFLEAGQSLAKALDSLRAEANELCKREGLL